MTQPSPDYADTIDRLYYGPYPPTPTSEKENIATIKCKHPSISSECKPYEDYPNGKCCDVIKPMDCTTAKKLCMTNPHMNCMYVWDNFSSPADFLDPRRTHIENPSVPGFVKFGPDWSHVCDAFAAFRKED
jgi:hypothetical protein